MPGFHKKAGKKIEWKKKGNKYRELTVVGRGCR
jgi:hypothetical protein